MGSEYLSADALTAPRPGEDLDVPGLGKVRVRGLSRKEAQAAGQAGDSLAIQAHMVASGLVEPAIDVERAQAWQDEAGSHGAFMTVFMKIDELTQGGGKAAVKAAFKSVRPR